MINPMGIKLLNKYIKNDWRDIADVCSFKKLKGKKICVDIYNYIYTFLGDNRLIEDLSKLCYIMYKNNIQCLFVFDGKYIEEKTQGYGAAIRKGMSVSTGDYIVLCEPDGTFTAQDIDKFLAYLDNFECVFGTRTFKSLIQDGAKMQFYLRYGNILVAKVLEYLYLGPSLTDVGCTYKVISRNAYDKVKDELKVVGSEFQPELMIRILLKNIKTIEIPVNYLARKGKSKITYNFFVSLKLAIKMLLLIFSLRIQTLF